MVVSADINLERSKKATQAIFLVCGLGISSWAIMVPYAKYRLGLNDERLGLLLLLLGAGAITMMPVTGVLIHKFGSRIVILVSSFVVVLTLPLLLIMNSVAGMGVILFLFGSAIGTVDVAMNAHGVQVQNLYGKPIMSSLHGLFSVGGLLGSLGLGFLIKTGLSPLVAAVSISALLFLIIITQYHFLIKGAYEKEVIKNFSIVNNSPSGNKFSWLKMSIIYLGLLCFAVFLSEGAMLDWSALFLKEDRGVNVALAGIGYAAFSIAMATMRLVGDKIVSRFNSKNVVVYGSLVAASGLFLAVFTPWIITSLLGFILLGIGAANIVPVFFSEGGRLKDVPSSVAVPAISTFGYAGQLVGPATLGFIAHHTSLPTAFGFIAFLLLLVGLSFSLKKSS
ncbi:MFS transporter [Mucilaginibacter sp. X4EP1]|uniref:MFS transporter n=1 Tax=Mucilaginibacter sp. X4EP1 TaxID=2723092 RepID=UPI0021677697|nr:MFS transporter [Mucilaginibacter sp. X4EP1]MCS3816276.1 putative MFS family arabinose efflux permease [Mucilaginibacter sp. X4EP1]